MLKNQVDSKLITLPLKREKVLDVFFKTAAFFLLALFTPSLLAVTGFIFNIPITFWHFPLSMVGAVALTFLLAKLEGEGKYRETGMAVLFGVILLGLLLPLFGYLRADFFHDPVWYHIPAVYGLLDGWNPLKGFFYDPASQNLWINYFPKASWYYSAVFSKFWGDISFGKSYHALAALASTFIALVVFCRQGKGKNLLMRVLVCVGMGLNPVFITQMPSHYNDSLMGSLLFCLLLVFVGVELKAFSLKNPFAFSVIALAIALCLNIKFSGLLFIFAFCALYGLVWLARSFKARKAAMVLPLALPLLVGLALAALIGIHPYFTNVAQGHSVLYPMLGYTPPPGELPVMVEHGSLVGMPHVVKVFVSLFSATGAVPILKAPWSLQYLSYETKNILHDSNFGGFGPFFALTLLFATAFMTVRLSLQRQKEDYVILALMGAIVLVNLVVPWTWWARYYPLLWNLPFLMLLLGLMHPQHKTYEPFFLNGTLLLAFLNIAVVAVSYYGIYYLGINQDFHSLMGDRPSDYVEVHTQKKRFQGGIRRMFERYGIHVTFVKEMPYGDLNLYTTLVKYVH